MTVEAKIKSLSIDLQTIGLSSSNSPSSNSASTMKQDQTNGHIADSWEDDASDPENDTTAHTVPLEAPGPTHLKSPESRAVDAARDLDNLNLSLNASPTDVPPPTPISPSLASSPPTTFPPVSSSRPQPASSSDSRSTPVSDRKRPEKTTSTANRLIAGALGIRAPPRTEEQKHYDRAAREAEAKRRNREKEEKAQEEVEREKARNAVWDDSA